MTELQREVDRWLMQYRSLLTEIEIDQELLVEYEADAVHRDQAAATGAVGVLDPTEQQVERRDFLREMADRCRVRIEENKATIAEIEQTINALPPNIRLVFRYRYILGKSWVEIAERIGKDVSNVNQMRVRGIAEILRVKKYFR